MSEFSDYLASLMKEKGVTPTDLMQRTGKSYPYINQLLNDKRHPPRPVVMQAISEALHATPAENKKLMGFSLKQMGVKDSSIYKGEPLESRKPELPSFKANGHGGEVVLRMLPTGEIEITVKNKVGQT